MENKINPNRSFELANGLTIKYTINECLYPENRIGPPTELVPLDEAIIKQLEDWCKQRLEEDSELIAKAHNIMDDALRVNFSDTYRGSSYVEGVEPPKINQKLFEAREARIEKQKKEQADRVKRHAATRVSLCNISIPREHRYEIHPAANMFPYASLNEFHQLTLDIKENGQKVPIKLYKGRVLDGRTRLKACAKNYIKPIVEEIGDQDIDPYQYVISMNCMHRHMTTSQRAWVAARLLQQQKESGSQKIFTNKELSVMFSISERQVAYAKDAQKHLVPEIFHEIEKGRMTLHQALKFAKLDEEERQKVYALPCKDWMWSANKEIKNKRKPTSFKFKKSYTDEEKALINKAIEQDKKFKDQESWIKQILIKHCREVLVSQTEEAA